MDFFKLTLNCSFLPRKFLNKLRLSCDVLIFLNLNNQTKYTLLRKTFLKICHQVLLTDRTLLHCLKLQFTGTPHTANPACGPNSNLLHFYPYDRTRPQETPPPYGSTILPPAGEVVSVLPNNLQTSSDLHPPAYEATTLLPNDQPTSTDRNLSCPPPYCEIDLSVEDR